MAKVGDVVLIYVENQPAFFARIESIKPDVKPEWFQVKMIVLQIPMMVVTWILREAYINGTEFTMGGRPMRITPVVAPVEFEDELEPGESEKEDLKKGSDKVFSEKVISLSDKKRKK
ncbi:MAG: hypothetical protein N2260_00275 [Syntrophobacterales bacterium]|nr:hypothetical protein [Syntrophobacterales bacterium]